MDLKQFSPLNIGILIGFFLGVANTLHNIIKQDYFTYHLQNTIIKTLVYNINYHVPLAILSVYFISLLFIAVKRSKGRLRKFNYSLIIALIAAFIAYKTPAYNFVASIIDSVSTPGVISSILSVAGWNIAGAAIVIFAGVLLIKNTSKYTTKVKKNRDFSVFFLKLLNVTNSRKQCYILLAILTILNLTAKISYLATKASVSDKPNVVLIIVDTIRADHLSCYNPSLKTTPNIDNLAKDGIRFNNAIAQAPYTTWSIGSFYTSRYPDVFYGDYIPENYLTIAETLKDNGYSTSAVISNNLLYSKYHFNQGYDFYDDSNVGKAISSPTVTSVALKQLKKIKDTPFFLTVHYMDPHMPYNLHEQYNFYPNYKGNMVRSAIIPPDSPGQTKYIAKDDLKYMKSVYDSEIKFTDYYIGKLITGLKKEGVYENSVIVIVGDHGEEFLDHGGWTHKKTLYKEVLSVPCIIRMPNCTNRGKTVSGYFGLIDLYPSILKYLNIDYSKYQLAGKSQDISSIERCQDRYIYSALTNLQYVNNSRQPILRSVQFGRYKYIEDIGNNHIYGLSDLITDPKEQKYLQTNNVIFKYYKKTLHDHLTTIATQSDNINKETNTYISEEEKKILRSNGYLQ